MQPINRSVLIVRGKQPFVDWINDHPEAGDEPLTIEQVNREPTAYLIEDYVDDNHLTEVLRDVYLDIFFHEMWSWYTDAADSGPAKPTFEAFQDWFEVEPCSLVLDLYEDPIEKETSA